ncbi:MAG: hypothetical protein JNL32_14205, partial [Candidatus Kapabacteria bacterium]|nr:hypothetical protein [Candidatus Kapabacteria bacterium]
MPRIARHTLLITFIAFTLVCGMATIFMYTKVQERDAYMNAMESMALSGNHCATRDDTVLTLAREIYQLTNNDHGISLNKLDWYEKFESTFFFNMT